MNKSLLTKEKFVDVFESAGINRDQQHRFHTEFEKKYPDEHSQFLKMLQIPDDEIVRIKKAAI